MALSSSGNLLLLKNAITSVFQPENYFETEVTSTSAGEAEPNFETVPPSQIPLARAQQKWWPSAVGNDFNRARRAVGLSAFFPLHWMKTDILSNPYVVHYSDSKISLLHTNLASTLVSLQSELQLYCAVGISLFPDQPWHNIFSQPIIDRGTSLTATAHVREATSGGFNVFFYQ